MDSFLIRLHGSLLLLATTGVVSAQGLVSLYDFNNSLTDVYDRDGFAQALDFRAGRATSSSIAATYSSATVGSATKQVANFTDPTNSEQFFRATHGMGPHGGSAHYVNQFTIVMDLQCRLF